MLLVLDSIDVACNVGPIESLALVQKLGIIYCLGRHFDLSETARNNIQHHPKQEYVHLDFHFKEFANEDVFAVGTGVEVECSKYHLNQLPISILPHCYIYNFIFGLDGLKYIFQNGRKFQSFIPEEPLQARYQLEIEIPVRNLLEGINPEGSYLCLCHLVEALLFGGHYDAVEIIWDYKMEQLGYVALAIEALCFVEFANTLQDVGVLVEFLEPLKQEIAPYFILFLGYNFLGLCRKLILRPQLI